MSAREELAQSIATNLDRVFGKREFGPATQDYALADALLAEGWGKLADSRAADIRAAELEAAADEAESVIACGDVAECAAFVDGEVGRAEALSGRDELYEDPASWLRSLAAAIRSQP